MKKLSFLILISLGTHHSYGMLQQSESGKSASKSSKLPLDIVPENCYPVTVDYMEVTKKTPGQQIKTAVDAFYIMKKCRISHDDHRAQQSLDQLISAVTTLLSKVDFGKTGGMDAMTIYNSPTKETESTMTLDNKQLMYNGNSALWKGLFGLWVRQVHELKHIEKIRSKMNYVHKVLFCSDEKS